MWRLIKSEFLYNKIVLLNLFAQSLLSFFILHHWTRITGKPVSNTNIGIIAQVHMFFFFVSSFLISAWWKENRIRHVVLFPVSPIRIGAARLLFFMIYWTYIIILYFVYIQISEYFQLDGFTLTLLISQTGFIMIVYSVFCIGMDLIKTVAKWRMWQDISIRKLMGIVLVSLILFLSFLTTAGIVHNYQGRDHSLFDDFLSWLYQSYSGTLLLVLLGVVLSVLNIRIFANRVSYVE